MLRHAIEFGHSPFCKRHLSKLLSAYPKDIDNLRVAETHDSCRKGKHDKKLVDAVDESLGSRYSRVGTEGDHYFRVVVVKNVRLCVLGKRNRQIK